MKRNILLVCCLASAASLSVRAETIVALTAANRLLSFDHATPQDAYQLGASDRTAAG